MNGIKAFNKIRTYNLFISGLFVAIMSVCAWIAVPFGAVPITLQTLCAFVIGGLVGFNRSVCIFLVYIILGVLGLPIFHGFTGGAGVLFGATGGYIIGLLFIMALVGLARDKVGIKIKPLMFSMMLGLFFCYLFGTLWFMFVYGKNFEFFTVIMTCVLPFLLPDFLKILVALVIIRRISRFIKI